MSTAIPVLIVLLSALIQAGAVALIKYSTKLKVQKPDSKTHIFVFIIALFLYAPSFVLWAEGLSRMSLAIVQPVFSGSMFLFTILFSMLFFKEKLAPYKYLGFAAIIGGIFILVM